MGFIISCACSMIPCTPGPELSLTPPSLVLDRPFISPFLLGFMVASDTWRNAYWVGVAYVIVVVLLIVFFMEETMYDRDVVPFPERPSSGLRYRVETLLGVTGVKVRYFGVEASWGIR